MPSNRILCLTILIIIISFISPLAHSDQNDLKRAEALSLQAKELSKEGRFTDAASIIEQYAKIFENNYGMDHPKVAESLNNLAEQYHYMGKYDEAESLYKQALKTREKTLGPDNLDVAETLNELAVTYIELGKYAEAEAMAKRALSIWEKTLGSEGDHTDVAKGLNSLAVLYVKMENYAEAEPLNKRALSIWEKTLGPDHPNVALSINNLAVLYARTGKYAEAEPLNKRALSIWEKTLGPDHPNVALSINNLAYIYTEMGKYAEAEVMAKRALSIWEKTLGPDHPNVALSINNLAVLYIKMEKYADAERLCKRALSIYEKSFGPDHQDVALSINNLADLYLDMGKYAEAEPLFKRALSIWEKTLGPDHPSVGMCLNNLAQLYTEMGKYAEAEPLFKRALIIYEKSFGTEHPSVGACLNNLAGLYMNMGKYAEAELLQLRALDIWKKSLIPNHPNLALINSNISATYLYQNRFQEAYKYLSYCNIIDEDNIDQLMWILSEKDKLNFLSSKQDDLTTLLSIISFYIRDDLSAKKDSLNYWLRRKGIVLESQRRFQEALIYGDNPEIIDVFKELSRTRVEISRLYFKGEDVDEWDKIKEEIAKLEKQRNELDAKLSKLCQPYAEKQKIRQQISVRSVAKNLPLNSALLEFIRIPKLDLSLPTISFPKGQEYFVNHDVVFIVFPDENLEIVDLGPSDAIDSAVNALKKEISLGKTDTKPLSAISQNLHALVFAKIKGKIGVTRELFISPDGSLSLIPFEVLQDKNGHFLIEYYTFNYLSSGRDILGFGHVFEKSNKALIVGDPDFEKDIAPPTVDGKTQQRTVDVELKIFPALPGTRKEIEEIANIIGHDKSVVYSGKHATEEALISFHNPELLHMATHGFFKADQPVDLNFQPTMMRDFSFVTSGQIKIPGKKIVTDNPLYRSGLILAGANRTIRGESTSDDGILTAEKILNLRLWGTKLVVLSACDTGLGEVHNGEGIFGLRRTFNQVGAKSLVMSMWKVPDKETQELMVNFYRNIYEKRMDYNKALRQATLDQMQTVKTRYGHANPYYWGAFIFSGDPNL